MQLPCAPGCLENLGPHDQNHRINAFPPIRHTTQSKFWFSILDLFIFGGRMVVLNRMLGRNGIINSLHQCIFRVRYGFDMGLTENMAPRFRHTSWFIIIFPVKMAVSGGGPAGQTWQVEIPCNQHLHFQGIFHCSPQESHGISWSKGRTGAMVPPPPDSSALSPGHPGMSSWLRTGFPAHGL